MGYRIWEIDAIGIRPFGVSFWSEDHSFWVSITYRLESPETNSVPIGTRRAQNNHARFGYRAVECEREIMI